MRPSSADFRLAGEQTYNARMIPCAFLRVFRTLDSFSLEEREEWERYIAGGGAPPVARPVYRDEPMEERRRVGLLASAQGEYADVRLIDGTYYVCPWRTRLRILTGILSLRESAPPEMVDTFVPESEARRAARELARLKRRDPSVAPSILQSPWHVPVRWFVLVDDPERRLVETPAGGFRVHYWTPIGAARKRAERALQALRRSELSPVAEPVRELAEWLSRFPRDSMVELDYGSVSSMFTWDELDNDHSGHDIQEAIDALTRPGGMAQAADLYQGVANRWAETLNRESLN
jgi:hypothetical protein